MKTIIGLSFILLSKIIVGQITTYAAANNKIKVYFNKPVDNTVSNGVNAVYLNQTMDDTLIAYINRATKTIDIAQFEYIQNSNFSNIATALNNAISRGVKVRYIYDGSATNSGMSAFNSSIHTLASPTTSAYGIMHNKFIIIDGRWKSIAPQKTYLITGSPDWNDNMFNNDYNNIIIFQDSAIAHAYTHEFNIMWGDTGDLPNTSLSKFGPYKPNSGRHNFVIGGNLVQVYFSPSDTTYAHILNIINTANDELYFGMYTYTDTTSAHLIVNKYHAGIYTKGIVDQYSASYSAYNILLSGLGSSNFKKYSNSSYIYHSKYLIIDPNAPCSNPVVITGSENWTNSAYNKNDENMVIIYDDTIANIFYQAFYKDFTTMGGSITKTNYCTTTDVASINNHPSADVYLFPNPVSEGTVYFNSCKEVLTPVYIELMDISGKIIETYSFDKNQNTFSLKGIQKGIYFVRIICNNNIYVQKLIVE